MSEIGETPENIQQSETTIPTENHNRPSSPSRRKILGLLGKAGFVGALLANKQMNPTRASAESGKQETKTLLSPIPEYKDDLSVDEPLEKTQAQLSVNTESTPVPEFEAKKGEHKVLVIMVKNPNTPAPHTIEQQEEMLKNMADFYRQESDGKFQLTADIVRNENGGWFDFDMELNDKDTDGSAEEFDAKIRELSNNNKLPNGNKIENYQSVIYMIAPSTDVQTISGYGQVTGNARLGRNKMWIYTGEYKKPDQTLKHEAGHAALGLKHVDGMTLLDSNDYSNIAPSRPANSDNVMGNRYDNPLSGIHKIQLGWLKPEEVIQANESGEYTLSTLQNQDGNYRMMRIFRPDTKDYYYIEYSKPAHETTPLLKVYRWDQRKQTPALQIIMPFSEQDRQPYEFYDKVNNIRLTVVGKADNEIQLNLAA